MYVNLNKVERIKDAIESIHGSGVNYDYSYEIGYTRRCGIVVKATNAYDVMDDVGQYIDTIKFSVKVPVDNPGDFKILVPANENGFYGDSLKDYLEQPYEFVLEKV